MKKVLVVDDERSIQFLYSEELTEEGYDVMVDDGSGVMDLLSESRPDLVILDLKLKGSSGSHLLQEIRGRFGLPVIVSTAHPDPGALEAESIVEKSFDLALLKQEVKRLLAETAPAAGPSWAIEPAVSLLPMVIPEGGISKLRP
jgi:DNA-binding response OmpR family regulator